MTTPLQRMAKQIKRVRDTQPRVTLKEAQAQAKRFMAAKNKPK